MKLENLIIAEPEHERGITITQMAIMACMSNLSSCSGIRNVIVVDDRKPPVFNDIKRKPIELIPSPSVMMSGKEARRLRRKNNKNK